MIFLKFWFLLFIFLAIALVLCLVARFREYDIVLFLGTLMLIALGTMYIVGFAFL